MRNIIDYLENADADEERAKYQHSLEHKKRYRRRKRLQQLFKEIKHEKRKS